MTTAAVIGGTGFVGTFLLKDLAAQPTFSKIHAITRRAVENASANQENIVEAESSNWTTKLASIQPAPTVFFSTLGTTRADAGGLENQRKIDFDLNLDMAKAAKVAGSKIYVLLSSAGANATAYAPYMKMKGELDDAVAKLDFEQTIIVRPGLLAGDRNQGRLGEGIARRLASFTDIFGMKDFWAQDADVVARALVHASLKALNGEAPSKVWIISQKDVLELGRTTWPPKEASPAKI